MYFVVPEKYLFYHVRLPFTLKDGFNHIPTPFLVNDRILEIKNPRICVRSLIDEQGRSVYINPVRPANTSKNKKEKSHFRA
jgi:hypothetical protein